MQPWGGRKARDPTAVPTAVDACGTCAPSKQALGAHVRDPQVKAFAESALAGSLQKQQAKLEEAEALVKSGAADKEVRVHACVE